MVKSLFEDIGFRVLAHEIVVQTMAPGWPSFADKMAARSDSFLARIPDDEFHAGMASLRDRARNADPGEPVSEAIDFFAFQRMASGSDQ